MGSSMQESTVVQIWEIFLLSARIVALQSILGNDYILEVGTFESQTSAALAYMNRKTGGATLGTVLHVGNTHGGV